MMKNLLEKKPAHINPPSLLKSFAFDNEGGPSQNKPVAVSPPIKPIRSTHQQPLPTAVAPHPIRHHFHFRPRLYWYFLPLLSQALCGAWLLLWIFFHLDPTFTQDVWLTHSHAPVLIIIAWTTLTGTAFLFLNWRRSVIITLLVVSAIWARFQLETPTGASFPWWWWLMAVLFLLLESFLTFRQSP
jgi:hypothetical protein